MKDDRENITANEVDEAAADRAVEIVAVRRDIPLKRRKSPEEVAAAKVSRNKAVLH
jgi:hypothetical protein